MFKYLEICRYLAKNQWVCLAIIRGRTSFSYSTFVLFLCRYELRNPMFLKHDIHENIMCNMFQSTILMLSCICATLSLSIGMIMYVDWWSKTSWCICEAPGTTNKFQEILWEGRFSNCIRAWHKGQQNCVEGMLNENVMLVCVFHRFRFCCMQFMSC